MATIEKILENKLCVGCGLCESVSGCKMLLNDSGFYKPDLKSISKEQDKRLSRLCPGININNSNKGNTDVWGHVEAVYNAWSSDEEIRKSSSSGGVTSALAIYLLESKQVDGVLHVGCKEGTYLYNKLYVSRTREDVLKRNASRYAPAEVFNEIFKILDSNPGEKFAFIGKPCDIAAIRNLQQENPKYIEQIPYCLAIFCAGIPSYNATKDAIATFKKDGEPIALRYRGDGWPGYFKADYSDGTACRMTYNESWGKILGRQLGFRCKICPDGIGMLADIASGDAWNTKNGYPDFTESEGRNFCFIRTHKGLDLFLQSKNTGYIGVDEINVSEIKHMQSYQYTRRKLVGWGIALVQLLTLGLLNFKNIGYLKMAAKANIYSGLIYAKGTYKRFTK